MPKFFVKWQVDPTKIPANPEEMAKSWLAMLEMTKADINAGKLKDWGMDAGASWGYGIMQEASEAEVFTDLLKWIPYIQFEVTPVLTVEQVVESIKKAAAAAMK